MLFIQVNGIFFGGEMSYVVYDILKNIYVQYVVIFNMLQVLVCLYQGIVQKRNEFVFEFVVLDEEKYEKVYIIVKLQVNYYLIISNFFLKMGGFDILYVLNVYICVYLNNELQFYILILIYVQCDFIFVF